MADKRLNALVSRMTPFLQAASAAVPGLARQLSGVAIDQLRSPADLARIPVLRKPELMAAQAEHPPFGGFADPARLEATRFFVSPGPVFEPQPPGTDPWRAAVALTAAGIGRGDVVLNCFSYHLTPGAWILDEGARALGASVIPGGVGNTAQQVEAAFMLGATAYVGTPDFLKVLLDEANGAGTPLTGVTKALVSGGALFPALRNDYAARGVRVMQCYATADLGVIAHEEVDDTGALCPGMVVSDDIIVEIVRPGTDDPVAAGEVGEVVVTTFNPAYPLVRFGTGDLSKVLIDPVAPDAPMRLAGWMGRADQRTKIKGMFVDPKQVAEIVKQHPEIAKARLVVTRDGDRDAMVLQVEGAIDDPHPIAATLKSVTGLSGVVEAAAPGTLPNDGKVIDDRRDYTT